MYINRGLTLGSLGNLTMDGLMLNLRNLNLTSGLKLCLDAGSAFSAPPGATSWLDMSGNGYDFFRGTTAGAEATDPTFNGTPGGLSANEYWTSDGADFFRYDTTNETWMQNIHKNNAVFSIISWLRLANVITTNKPIVGTAGTGSTTGFSFLVQPNSSPILHVENAGTTVLDVATTSVVVANAWTFVAITLNEAADASTLQVNATQFTNVGTYTTPASGNATNTMELGADGGGNLPWPNTSRLAQLAMWEGTALNAAGLDAIFQATRGRFGV